MRGLGVANILSLRRNLIEKKLISREGTNICKTTRHGSDFSKQSAVSEKMQKRFTESLSRAYIIKV